MKEDATDGTCGTREREGKATGKVSRGRREGNIKMDPLKGEVDLSKSFVRTSQEPK